jgi:ADP-ribosyl-[dinitrogen reductase] hydrolase
LGRNGNLACWGKIGMVGKEKRTPSNFVDKVAGTILGTAVGDALGLPREGLSAVRASRLFGDGPLRHRFVFGRGMVSDDTEHTCMVGQALLRSPADPARFARSLAWRLRWWLLGLPAGIGVATLRALLKLWLGFPPANSGVFSAGNGPAMRAALLGVCLGDHLDHLRSFIRSSTRLTHTDPRAERGALLVALAAHYGMRHGAEAVTADGFLDRVRKDLPDLDAELADLLAKVKDHLGRNLPASALAETLRQRRGISGYIYRTVPVALYVWLRSPGDYRTAVEEVIRLGGDTDSTAAIVGALVGATAGVQVIPVDWLAGLLEWPRSVAWMRALAARLAEQFAPDKAREPQRALRLFWPGLIPRNLVFLAIVLLHGFRRLLPPY